MFIVNIFTKLIKTIFLNFIPRHISCYTYYSLCVSSYRRRQFASKRGNIATKRRTGSHDRAFHLQVDFQVPRKRQRRARDRFVKNAIPGAYEE